MDENKLMDWDDEIAEDGQQFVTLTEGDYPFEVTNFERAHHPGSANLPACPKASLTLKFDTKEGAAYSFVDLFLVKKMEWKLSEFFRAIGMKKHGERVNMDWNRVMGAKGVAHVKPTEYTSKSGELRTKNEVVRFLDYDEKNFPNDGFMEIPDGVVDELPFN